MVASLVKAAHGTDRGSDGAAPREIHETAGSRLAPAANLELAKRLKALG
jgi:hypothetical protein